MLTAFVAQVSLEEKRAVVTYDAQITTIDSIMAVIDDAGFIVSLSETQSLTKVSLQECFSERLIKYTYDFFFHCFFLSPL